MSRTYRFKGEDKYRIIDSWVLEEYEYVWIDKGNGYQWREWTTVHIDQNSKEGKKRLARFHSDKKRHVMVWNAPGWFNRLFSQKPHRMAAKKELHKFKLDPEHEVIISKPHQEYYW